MATIKLKKSSVVGRIPNVSDLAYGEVALNFADGKIYYKNSSNDIKGFIDSDGVQDAISSRIAGLTTDDIAEGGNLYYTDARWDSALGKSSSISSIRGYFSASGDLSYDSSTGQFSFDVENVYTQSNFDSDFNTSLDAAALGGTGLTYVGTSNTLNITNTGVTAQGYGDSSRIPVFSVNEQGQITYATEVKYPGVSSLSYDTGSGQVSLGTIDSQTFTASVTLDPFTTTNLSEGDNLYYTKARFDSDLKSVTGAPGGLEFTDSGELQIRASGVVAGTYGSASQIPVIRITNQGRIDSAGTIAVAGVSSTAFDSAGFTFDVNTADGGTFTEMIHTKMPGTSGTYGSSSQVPIITVNEFGHVDSVSTTSIAGIDSSSWDSATGVLTISTSDGSSYSNRILEQELGPNDNVAFKSVQMYVGDSHLPYSEGLLWYDTRHKSLNYYSDDSDVVHELGLEEHQRVYNNTGSTILKGQPLYFAGNYIDPNGEGVPTVGLADATDVNAYNAQGLAASDIPTGEYGYCIIAGQLHDVDTSGLNAGTNFFVGLGPGLKQNASPLYPNYPMCLGWVVRSHATEGILLLNQQNHSVRSFRVQTSAHIGEDLQVDGNLTVLGTQTTVGQNNVTQGAPFYRLNEGDAIGEAGTTFIGSGLDDAFFAGHFTGPSPQTYYVKIDGVGTGPGGVDTFAVALGTDSTFSSPILTNEAITGNPQLIHSTDNISVEFGSTTGHDSGDIWKGTASPVNVDTGFFTNRNTGTTGVGYTHMGFFFDVSDEKWKVLDEYDSTPTGVISVTDSSLGTLVASSFEGSLDYSYIANKPDPTITFNMTGEVTGSGSTTLTDLASGSISVTSTIDPTLDLTLQSLSVTDLTVTGTQTITNTETLSTGAANIFLNDSQISEPDMGLFVGYNDSYWGGIFRDATDNKWKIFNDYTPNLESSGTVDISDSSFTLATVQVGTLEATTLQGNLNWSYIQDKPDPQVTVTLTGEVTGTGSGTLTDLGNGTVSLATAIDPNANVVLNNLDVTNNLNVYGTTTTVEQTNLAVSDTKIFLADKNPSDALDIAVLFEYNDGVDSQHSGLFRDASDGKFKFFKTYTDSIGNTINIADSSFALATVVADRFEGDFVGSITGSYAGFDSDFAAKSTTDLTEGTNLYYTQARVDSDILSQVDSAYVEARSAPSVTIQQVDSADNVELSVANVSTINFDNYTGFNVTDEGSGSVKVALGSGFKTIQVDGESDLVAVGEDTLKVEAGNGISLTTNAGVDPKALNISADSSFVTGILESDNTYGNVTFGQNNPVIKYTQSYAGGLTFCDNTNSSTLSNQITFKTNNTSIQPVIISLWKNSSSPAVGDQTGKICFIGTDTAGAGFCAPYNAITSYIDGFDLSQSRHGHLEITTRVNGSNPIGGSTGEFVSASFHYDRTKVPVNNLQIGEDSTSSTLTSAATVDRILTLPDASGTILLESGDGSGLTGLSTTIVSEGTNLYYTTARSDSDFDVRLATKSTTDLSEGTNLYYTQARVDSDILSQVDSAYVAARQGALNDLTDGFYDSATGVMSLGHKAVGQINADITCNGRFNVGFGPLALTSILRCCTGNSGSCNTVMGYHANACGATAWGNTMMGYKAGCCNLNYFNVNIGACAGAEANGAYNTYIGAFTGINASSGRNVAVGPYAQNSGGLNNTSIGYFAARYQTTGCKNVAVGCCAMLNNTTGFCNVSMGNDALKQSTTGSYNVAIGTATLNNLTIGKCNTAIGFNAGLKMTSGNCNVLVGRLAGACSTEANDNVLIGKSAGYSTTTGCQNTIIGSFTLINNTTGTNNVAVGYNTLACTLSVSEITAVGTNAMSSTATAGTQNTAVGYDALCTSAGAYNTAVGHSAGRSITTGSRYVALGYHAAFKSDSGEANTIIGNRAYENATAASNNVVIGDSAGTILLDGNDNSNVIIGSCALSNSAYLDSASADIVNNVVIGALAGRCMAKGCNIAIGYNAYSNNVTGCRSTVVGYSAMTCATTGRDNVAIGYKALDQWTGECNTAIGSNSMRFSAEAGTVMGFCNTAVGSAAAYCMQDGCRNTFVGANSGWIASSRGAAYANTFIGGGSGWRVNGDFNAGIGWEAGLNVDSGECNTLLGTSAGYGLTTGSLNTFAGSFVGCNITTGCNNILIGANVGRTVGTGTYALDLDSQTSDAIVIGNSGSRSFDIYNLSFNIDSNGETNAVDFNTTSDLSLKDNIEAINNGIDIVNKINPVSFNWKSSGKKAYGVIAQEIEEVIPEIVSKNSKGNKTVSYSQIIAFLVDAVKQQQKDIEELKSKIK